MSECLGPRYWLIVVSERDWCVVRENSVYGVSRESIYGLVKAGDFLVFYAKRKGSRSLGGKFVGVFRVVSEWYRGDKPLWPSEVEGNRVVYFWRVRLEPVVLDEVGLGELLPRLSFIEDKGRSSIYFRGVPANLKKPLPAGDAELIVSCLGRRVSEGVGEELRRKVTGLEERVSRLEGLLGVRDLPLSLNRECVEFMLISVGRMLGFCVYTADSSKRCNNVRLGDLANMSRVGLIKFAGSTVLDSLSRIDVVWYDPESKCFYAFEVVARGEEMRGALERLTDIRILKVKPYVVSFEDRRSEFEKALGCLEVRGSCKFLSVDNVVRMYIFTRLCRHSTESL